MLVHIFTKYQINGSSMSKGIIWNFNQRSFTHEFSLKFSLMLQCLLELINMKMNISVGYNQFVKQTCLEYHSIKVTNVIISSWMHINLISLPVSS